MTVTRPCVLVIRDGWGVAPPGPGNAVSLARVPVLERLLAEGLVTPIEACGEAVGLPCGQMGNSEVGHMNFGAGRVVRQDLTRIDLAVREGRFDEHGVLRELLESLQARGTRLHLIGLVSDGGVHSSLEHLYAILERSRVLGPGRVWLHALTDGRDTPPRSADAYVAAVEERCAALGVGRIATLGGRYYGMDRDQRWDRVAKAYAAWVRGEGRPAPSARAAIAQAYARGQGDEFIEPAVIQAGGRLLDGDGVVVFNFRADRVRQFTRALTDPAFDGFARGDRPALSVIGLTQYDERWPLPRIFAPQDFRATFAQSIAEAGLRQLRIAETEKYAHVTYFFNCGREEPWPLEERVLVPSPKVATYDRQPRMSALEVTDELVERLRAPSTDVVVCNYANPDMVGHTGDLAATIEALETVDACIGRIVEACRAAEAVLLVTADHGNAEQMIDPLTGGPHTAHTLNPVHCIYHDPRWSAAGGKPRGLALRRGGALCDIAPTLLEALGLQQPALMTGRSLLVRGDGV